MKQLIALAGVVTILITSCIKEDIEPNIRFDLTNSSNGFEYEITLTERNVGQNSFNNVMFVLDSDDLIPIVVKEYENAGYNNSLVLVGIKSKEDGKRVRDYTPTEINSEESGLASEFFHFIEQDLIPELESRQTIDSTSNSCLLGHSIGGLATCFAFSSFNALFNNYVALSPSLFWDDFVFFELEDAARAEIAQNHCNVFLGIGENEDFGITNGYSHFTEIIETHYPEVELNSIKVKGSHYGSRSELINKSLKFILK